MKAYAIVVMAIGVLLFSEPAFAANQARPTVVELFTAQGCPSCPKADAILKDISTHPGFLPLSYHVTYFDRAGWKDPYAKLENNLLQLRYLKAIGMEEAFTPHIVVDGTISAVGGNPNSVAEAISRAQKIAIEIPLSMKLSDNAQVLDVTVGDDKTPVPSDSILYEVHFLRSVATPIKAGDNDGLTVENVNNVIAYFSVPLSTQYHVPVSRMSGDGIAYVLHNNEGRIIGAAYYMKP
jgi:hypothetical protein